MPNPAAAVSSLLTHLKPGGVIAFIEMDIRAATAVPKMPLFDQCLHFIAEVYTRVGLEPDMGSRLFATFRAAGLKPQMIGSVRIEGPWGTAPYEYFVESSAHPGAGDREDRHCTGKRDRTRHARRAAAHDGDRRGALLPLPESRRRLGQHLSADQITGVRVARRVPRTRLFWGFVSRASGVSPQSRPSPAAPRSSEVARSGAAETRPRTPNPASIRR